MRLVRAVAFRGALWITLIALLSTGTALTVQYLQTSRLLQSRMQTLLADEMNGLLDRYAEGGVGRVAGYIMQQHPRQPRNANVYLLADADGTVLIGDLPAWPADIQATGPGSFDTQLVTASGRILRQRVDTLTITLGDRYRLLVGRLVEDRAEVRRQYVRAMILSLILTAALGLVLGWWFSRRSLRFVDQVSDAGQRFLAGRLEERVPISPRGDEYDRLARTMNASFDEIEHVVRSLRAATDGLAHDLKTPLTRLRSRLELAELRSADEGQLREVVQASRRDLDLLLRIIADVLDVAKAEGASMDSFSRVDLQQVVQEVIELYEPAAEDRGIKLELETDQAAVHGSRSLLGQLVANLIDNAIKFAPDHSQIAVSLRCADGIVTLCIGDRGPGVPPELRQEVLSRFVRLDSSRSRDGVGLGLSIVSAVVRVHRGKLELSDNEPGLRVQVTFAAADVVPDASSS